jgi:hypothetical protein
MTWRELKEYIDMIDNRFLDTEVQVHNCEEQITYTDTMFAEDDDDTDYVVDLHQPQIWFNTDDVTLE